MLCTAVVNKVGFFLLLVFASGLVQAQSINFETVPGASPSEGLAISNQYLATQGITFKLANGDAPVLAKVGEPTTAFVGPTDPDTGESGDTPAPDQEIGNYFLTDDGQLSGLTNIPLIVEYSEPTAAASGVILDIDFNERFRIEAYNATGEIVASALVTTADEGTGDGLATFWSLESDNKDIVKIVFTGSRTTFGAFGLGFDNFNARSSAPNEELRNCFMCGWRLALPLKE